MTTDRFRGVTYALIALAGVGVVASLVACAVSAICADAALVSAFAGAVLAGTIVAQRLRALPPPIPDPVDLEGPPSPPARQPIARLAALQHGIGGGATFVIAVEVLLVGGPRAARSVSAMIAGTALCAVGALASALVARYFARAVDPAELPEASLLARGARSAAWAFGALIAAQFALRFRVPIAAPCVHVAIVAIIAIACVELFWRSPRDLQFGGDLRLFAVTGARANFPASVLDAAERYFGIDLRATWALAYVRRRFVAVVLVLAAIGWASTALSVVGRDERAVIERFGVPLDAPPLAPGLHAHWPWPIDELRRVEVQHVRSIEIGHDGQPEPAGPENVLWARQHAAREYTLLVGDGHDLLTVDAALQFRITDLRAWLYRVQDPEGALRAAGYRAVMRATVDRTLEATLSENVARLAAEIRADVQRDADALGLGVEIVNFTVGGMHPPVDVAGEYEAVVSAEIGKTTSVIQAQADRNSVVPAAKVESLQRIAQANEDAADQRAEAAGNAWGFRALEARYRVDPAEYRFRSRLEALERGLAGKHFTIVDARILRDGGGLWLTP